MKMPFDVKGVLDAVTDTEEAKNLPIGLCVCYDHTAPADLTIAIEEAFRTDAPHARVISCSYDDLIGHLTQFIDAVVLVAGVSERTGALYHELQDGGFPTLIVTNLPAMVEKAARVSGKAIDANDIAAPLRHGASSADLEPIDLDEDTIERLFKSIAAWMVSVYPKKRLAYARAFTFMRHYLAVDAVKATSAQNAGIGLVAFIPGADLPLMTLNQIKMLFQIAAAYDQSIGLSRAKEILPIVAGGFACRALARQLVSVVPGLGWAFKASIGYGGTFAMGQALVEYFEQGGDPLALLKGAQEKAKEAQERAKGSAKSLQTSKGRGVVAKLAKAPAAMVSGAGSVVKDHVAPTVKAVGKAALDNTPLGSVDLGRVANLVSEGADIIRTARKGKPAR